MMQSFNPLVEKSTDTIDQKPPPIMKDPPSKKWKICSLILTILVIILVIILIVLTSKRQKKLVSKCSTNPEKKTQTPQGLKSDTRLTMTNPSVFQDLTSEELNRVRDYLFKIKTLKLTVYKNASLQKNFILGIELMMPPKNTVLEYLSKKGPKPVRKAKVTILNGAGTKPNVKEYTVWPLPNPSNHAVHKVLKHRDDVPYSKRPFTTIELVDAERFVGLLAQQNPYLMQILWESFGGSLVHKTRRLVSNPGGYGVDPSGERKVAWVGLRRSVEGFYLHNLPLILLLDHTEANFLLWKVQKVYYNEQYFDSVAELITKYKAGTLRKIKIPWPTDEEIQKGAMERRGPTTFQSPMLGPTLVEPSGRRFAIQGRKVSYSGWSFDIRNKLSTGLAVYNIKFKDKSVAYEISVQEFTSFYSSHDPQQSSSQFLESFLGLGAKYATLLNGVDCPQSAEYLDIDVFYDSAEAKRSKNVLCVFEMNEALPSRRHTDYYVGGHSDYALYVRGVIVAGNYDYIVDYIFHQNGVIGVQTTATGYLSTNHFFPNENDFGFQNIKGTIGTIHDHMVFYKVDLDVHGTKNSFQTLNIKPKKMKPVWSNDTSYVLKFVERDVKKKEKDATVRYDFDKPKYYTVINKNIKNEFGNAVGYRIVPKAMVKQVYPDDYFVNKAAAWSKYQIAVTKYKDTEVEASSPYNQFGLGNPVVNFDNFLQDNDDIENEDLVTWLTVGSLHIPSTEDIPNTVTTGISFSFVLKPYNFFPRDQTLGSRESVMIKLGKMIDYGLPTSAACPTINRTIG